MQSILIYMILVILVVVYVYLRFLTSMVKELRWLQDAMQRSMNSSTKLFLQVENELHRRLNICNDRLVKIESDYMTLNRDYAELTDWKNKLEEHYNVINNSEVLRE